MSTNTIRLSLSTIVLLIGVLVCIALAGGAIGSRMFSQPVPLRSDSNGTIVPFPQQVTVSPSKLASDIAKHNGKSIFLLAKEVPGGISALGTGIALTNDGVIISVADISEESIVGIGEDSTAFPLTLLGRDELTGISFYKANNKIVTPLNLTQNSTPVGSSLLALYRHNETAQLAVQANIFTTTLLPEASDAPGIQKIAQLETAPALSPGTALLDENGNLAGAIRNPENGTGIFTSDIRSALERLSSNRLTDNPFATLGFTSIWKAELDANRTMHIINIVTSVTNDSPADAAGLAVGDVLTAIAGNTVSWDTDIASALNSKPSAITIVRKGEQRTLSLAP